MAEWRIKGRYIEACNCAVGCTCNTTGFPTHGKCEANVAFVVDEGRRDGVDLSGAKVVASVQWPGAIHEGNGKMAVFIDAKEEQRNPLIAILTAQDGGLPWEILATTIKDISGPYFERIDFKPDGERSTLRVGDKVDVALKGLTNPVTGERTEARTVIPDGFIWKDGLICTSSTNRAKAGAVGFDHKGNSAYYAEIEWSNVKASKEATEREEASATR
jgi:hypothetical protein